MFDENRKRSGYNPHYKEEQLIRKNRWRRFNYYEFIVSEYWEAQKLLWFYRNRGRCAGCRSTDNLQLHHKLYPRDKRFLLLKDYDLVPLCKSCHYKYHQIYGVRRNMQTKTDKFIKVERKIRRRLRRGDEYVRRRR